MKNNSLLYLWIVLMFITSCNTRYYRAETQLNTEGEVLRSVYTLADSAFMAGNMKYNPFLFRIDSRWAITRYDTVFTYDFFSGEQKLNVRVARSFNSVEEMYESIKPVQDTDAPLATPDELLTSRFRWFYTYYTFTSIFREIPEKGPVPIGNYMSEKEQKLWFQGDMSGYRGMNGIELNEVLDAIGQKFWQWYSRSMYEISFAIVENCDEGNEDTLFFSRLAAVKDTVYIMNRPKEGENKEFTPEDVCSMLDRYFKTRHFSVLKNENMKRFETLFQEKTRFISLFDVVIRYELKLPGNPLSVNTALYDKGAWVWKVDAYRLLADDYTLKAEYRVVNVWAFVATFVLVSFAVYGLLKIYGNRKRKTKSY